MPARKGNKVLSMPAKLKDPSKVSPTKPLPEEIQRIFEAKKEWHRKQTQLPLQEKVRILIRMQHNYYPILKARGVLKPWQKPWECEP